MSTNPEDMGAAIAVLDERLEAVENRLSFVGSHPKNPDHEKMVFEAWARTVEGQISRLDYRVTALAEEWVKYQDDDDDGDRYFHGQEVKHLLLGMKELLEKTLCKTPDGGLCADTHDDTDRKLTADTVRIAQMRALLLDARERLRCGLDIIDRLLEK